MSNPQQHPQQRPPETFNRYGRRLTEQAEAARDAGKFSEAAYLYMRADLWHICAQQTMRLDRVVALLEASAVERRAIVETLSEIDPDALRSLTGSNTGGSNEPMSPREYYAENYPPYVEAL